MSWLWELMERVVARAIYVSLLLLLVGISLVLSSEYLISSRVETLQCRSEHVDAEEQYRCTHTPVTLPEMALREFGIVLCSIGLISLLYELIIRGQLMADYGEKLTEVINPDTRRLGILSLFEDRHDKNERHKSARQVIRSATANVMCFGLINNSIFGERSLILEKAHGGCHFKFLIFNPFVENETDRNIIEVLSRSLSSTTEGSLSNIIEAYGRDLRDVLKYFRKSGLSEKELEIRTFSVVPTFGAIKVDDSRLVVELYGYHKGGAECPGMEIARTGSYWQERGIEETDSLWYEFYASQLADLWEAGIKIPED